MDKSKRALIQAKEAIVMEGQIDLIAAFEQGCQNVVAPQGTAFTAEQAHLLRRFVERIILCFDSDSAGKNAVERSLPALLSQGFEVRIARLPQGEDPDSLIRKQGIAVFKSMIEQAEDFFEDAIVQAKVDHGGRLTPHETAALAKRLGGYLNLFPDATLREVTAAQVAAQLGISTVTLKESAQHIIFSSAQKIETLDPDPVEKISAGTELLCRLALADPEVRAWLRDQKNPSPREVDSELILLEELLALENFSSEESLAAILSQLSPRLQRLISSWDLEKKGTDPLKSAQDAWNGLKIAAWKREQTEAIAALKQPGIQPAVILTLQKKILELQELINTSNSSPKIAIDAS
jgi:DNA primase